MMPDELRAGSAGDATNLWPYVPRIVADPALALSGEKVREPKAFSFRAIVLCADIAGFTSLTETVMRKSERGAEEIQSLLNRCFDPIVRRIADHGGQVFKFAGDATLALWPVEDIAQGAAAVANSTLCAQAILAAVDRLDATEGRELQLRVGIGAGEAWAACVGGVEDRWEVLVAGDAVKQLCDTLECAEPGQVVLSEPAFQLGGFRLRGRPLKYGCFVVEETVRGIGPPVRAPATPPGFPALRCFVPRTLIARLEAGQEAWLSEFRRVSVAFVNLLGLDYGPPDSLAALQKTMRELQSAVYRFGGSVNQMIADEKGTTVVVCWGLSLEGHEDNAARAVLAAVEIRKRLLEIGVACRIGVSTGDVFTGQRGNAIRREYALIGDPVNLAARLMQAAESVLCDSLTESAARHRAEFEPLPPIPLKGKTSPVAVFRPLGPRAPRQAAGAHFIGRQRELHILAERLRALVEKGQGGTLVIEGEPGIGKSALIRQLLTLAESSGVEPLIGNGDAIETSTPYYAWRSITARILGGEEPAEKAAVRKQVLGLLDSIHEARERAPLLNPFLPVNFPENEFTRAMPAKARAEVTKEIVVRLFSASLKGKPVLLVLEDAHWMDSSSIALATTVIAELSPLLAVIATRPLNTVSTTDLPSLVDATRPERLCLEGLSSEETISIICRRLRVDSVPPAVERLAGMKVAGQPLFAEELAGELLHRSLVRVQSGKGVLAVSEDELESVKIPDTVQGLVMSRLDHLKPDQQLTLKVASVIGTTFEGRIVSEVHPIAADRHLVPQRLAEMTGLDLVQQTEGGRTFQFKHAVFRDVTYSLLTREQRRKLHSAAARWYEQNLGDAEGRIYALLGHHWRQAEDRAKAIDYLEMAGEQALRRDYANREARKFFSEILEMADANGTGVELSGDPKRFRVRQAYWEASLGEAELSLGKQSGGRARLERSLELLGRPVPSSILSWKAALARRASRQILHRLAPTLRSSDETVANDARMQAVRAYSKLGAAYYVLDRRVESLYMLVSATNLAETAAPSPDLACAYADMGNVAGVIPVYRLARCYTRLAKSTAAKFDDPACEAQVLGRTGIFRLGAADWDLIPDVERSASLSRRLGHKYQWEESTFILSRAHFARGQLEQSEELAAAVAESASASGASVHWRWARVAQAECALRSGCFERAIELCEQVLASIDQKTVTDPHTFVQAQGTLASALLRQGKLSLAEAAASAACRVIDGSPISYDSLQGYIGPIETYAAVSRAESIRASWANGRLRRYSKLFCRYARSIRLAMPDALFWRGYCELRNGWHGRSLRSFQRGLDTAKAMDTPFEEALAHLALARHPQTGAGHSEHQARAAEILRHFGVDENTALNW